MKTQAIITSLRLVLGFLAIGLAGCALGRSEIDVAVPPAHITEAKRTVTIIEIRDLRPFAVDPDDPASPSLASEADVHNPAVTERAVGRKRGSYGARLGDVLLPEGQTVTGLVRSAATTALREKGYIVVDDPSLPEVVPLSIDIEQFWAWFKPGLLQVTVEFDSQLQIYGRKHRHGCARPLQRGRSGRVRPHLGHGDPARARQSCHQYEGRDRSGGCAAQRRNGAGVILAVIQKNLARSLDAPVDRRCQSRNALIN